MVGYCHASVGRYAQYCDQTETDRYTDLSFAVCLQVRNFTRHRRIGLKTHHFYGITWKTLTPNISSTSGDFGMLFQAFDRSYYQLTRISSRFG